MTEPWRPLGVETEADVATYDALREGIPTGMEVQFWEWVQSGFSRRVSRNSGYTSFPDVYDDVRAELAEHAAQALSLPMKSVRGDMPHRNISAALDAMKSAPNPLAVADYLLAHLSEANGARLDSMLQTSRSAWTVGERAGRSGLIRRVPEAVSSQVGMVIRSSGTAGAKLSTAWEAIYGVTPNPSYAYSMAIRALEDVAIPAVVSRQNNATLGHVIGQMRNDGDWALPFDRVSGDAPAGGVPLEMCQMLWFGQHDRHGGVPSAPGSVSQREAEAAVSLAVSLVHWFSSGMLTRRSHPS